MKPKMCLTIYASTYICLFLEGKFIFFAQMKCLALPIRSIRRAGWQGLFCLTRATQPAGYPPGKTRIRKIFDKSKKKNSYIRQ